MSKNEFNTMVEGLKEFGLNQAEINSVTKDVKRANCPCPNVDCAEALYSQEYCNGECME